MIFLDRKSKVPLHKQIYAYMIEEIRQGRRKEKEILPSTRGMAKDLSISRNTVLYAYQQLEAEGYIESKKGSGYYICECKPEFIPIPLETAKVQQMKKQKKEYFYDFSYGMVDGKSFPYAAWKKCMCEAIENQQLNQQLVYPEYKGVYSLREAIRNHIGDTRGVNCTSEQIIITSGTSNSMNIIAQMFSHTGKRIGIEEPGYFGTRKVFENNKYTIVPIEVGKSGLNLDEVKDKEIDLLYITPSHQFPTGVVLPVGKRYELISLTKNKEFFMIEDDYDSELRYDTPPIPSLYSLAGNDKIIYCGTFSKTLYPGLRVSYLILPEKLLDVYNSYYERQHTTVSSLIQEALAIFINRNYYRRHLNKIRKLYREKQKKFKEDFNYVFKEEAVLKGDAAGIHFIFAWKRGALPENIVELCRNEGINISPLAPHVQNYNQNKLNSFIISFINVDETKYIQGLKKIKSIILKG